MAAWPLTEPEPDRNPLIARVMRSRLSAGCRSWRGSAPGPGRPRSGPVRARRARLWRFPGCTAFGQPAPPLGYWTRRRASGCRRSAGYHGVRLHALTESEDVGVAVGDEEGVTADLARDGDRQAGQLEWQPVQRLVGQCCVLLFDLVDSAYYPGDDCDRARRSRRWSIVWSVWSSRFAAWLPSSAAVCGEAAGAWTAAEESAPPPHAAVARPIPARSANKSDVLRLLLAFTCVPPSQASCFVRSCWPPGRWRAGDRR